MAKGEWLASISTVAYIIGFLILFCCGNAKHLSLRMIQLMFISHFLDIPPFGASDYLDVNNMLWWIILYSVCGAFFLWIIYEFYKPNCLFQQTYNPKLDNLRGSFLLFFLAAAVPILMIFFMKDGLFGCTPETFRTKGGGVRAGCIYSVAWTTSLCLFPLSLIPQLWILYKLRRDEQRTPTKNIRFFLLCMMIMSLVDIFVYAFTPLYLWQVAIFTNGIAFFFIGFPWITRMICNRGLKNDDEEEKEENENKQAGRTPPDATGGSGENDIELPQTTTEQQQQQPGNAQNWTSGHEPPPVTYLQPASQTTSRPIEEQPAPKSSWWGSSSKTSENTSNQTGNSDPPPTPQSNTTDNWGTGWLS